MFSWLRNLSKQKVPDADLKVIQQINFIANLDCAKDTTIFFIYEEAKETILDFSQEAVRVLWKGETKKFWEDGVLKVLGKM